MTTTHATAMPTPILPIYNNDVALATQPPSQGRTLLPAPIATGVSTLTGASSLFVRLGSQATTFWIGAAREATLTTLELSRASAEAVLRLAGRDVAHRRTGRLGRIEAESTLEKAISALHTGISATSFLAASGFYMSTAAVTSAADLSIHGLSTLNAILGSTESSRAVAAIITLMNTELNKPQPGAKGEPVGYFDLFTGTIAFVFLQRWGRRKTELEFRENQVEVKIWDTVIDDKGFRADVVASTKRGEADQLNNTMAEDRVRQQMSFLSPDGEEAFDAVERGTVFDHASLSVSPVDQTSLSDEELRAHIISQLPPGARAVITSETLTAKTIRVKIYNADATHVEAPPGTVMVAERLNHHDGSEDTDNEGTPHQTVVFRTAVNRTSNAEIELSAKLHLAPSPDGHLGDMDSDEDMLMHDTALDTPVTDAEDSEDFFHIVKADTKRAHPEAVAPSTSSAQPATSGVLANQKKSRRVDLTPSSTSRIPLSRPIKDKSKTKSKPEKTGPIRRAMKSLSPSQSSPVVKDAWNSATQAHKSLEERAALDTSISRLTAATPKSSSINKPLPQRPSSRTYGSLGQTSMITPPTSRTSPHRVNYTVRESRRNSVVSQTDTYSTHSIESRPGSPTFMRTRTRATSGLTRAKSDADVTVWSAGVEGSDRPGFRHHHRSKSYVPSLYSMTTKNEDEALILQPKNDQHKQSIFEDHKILTGLIANGKVPGMFPDAHLVRTARRFARFASASYGSSFLRVMGLASAGKEMSASTELRLLEDFHHHEHDSFSSHTGLPPDTILLSSFVDPQGVSGNREWSPSAISPLIHYISIDHDSKAVVLTCRGTLGFEDVLTDMACDYDILCWQGAPYKVHRGIHAAARRMLGGGGSRVMATIKATLEEYPDFGLIFCGHSLGGAVAAILAILISEPSSSSTSFVTASTTKLLGDRTEHEELHSGATSTYYIPPIVLPSGRPIHVYSYGTPATVSSSLRVASRGLITTIVNSKDIFPCLSIGTLHDHRSVALNLKEDRSGAFQALKERVMKRIWHAVYAAWSGDSGPPPPENTAGDGLGEDTWAWGALKTLRAGMTSEKLVPPGEVFVVETTRVFDRQDDSGVAGSADTATERVYRALGRPATRVQFKFVRDVEARFGEIQFSSSMFGDHNPAKYEASLAALERGTFEG